MLDSEKSKKSNANSQVDINESINNELKEDNLHSNGKNNLEDEANLKMRLHSMMNGLISSRPEPVNQNLDIPQAIKKKTQINPSNPSNHINPVTKNGPGANTMQKSNKANDDQMDQMEKIKMLRGLIKPNCESENKEKTKLSSNKRSRDPEEILKTLAEVGKGKGLSSAEKIKTIPLGKPNSLEENTKFYSSLKKVKNK